MPRLSEIVQKLGIPLPEGEDRIVRSVLPLREAGPQDLSFCSHPRYREDLRETRAGVVLVAPAYEKDVPRGTLPLVVPDPYTFLPDLLELFLAPSAPAPGIHPLSWIHPEARLGKNVCIGAFTTIGAAIIGDRCTISSQVYIGDGVEIGEDSVIHSGVKIMEGTKIGARVIIHPGAVIGSDGFGFVPGPQGIRKIPQIGRVVIGDDVEIGANTTIDRATLGETRIARFVKLDNLIQIGHNVEIGEGTVIAAQTGIAGSTRIGPYCRIGGQVGIAGHLVIGARVEIAAKTGVMRDIPDGERVAGIPHQRFQRWLRTVAILEKLPELLRNLRLPEPKPTQKP